jgi:hypothetical protein
MQPRNDRTTNSVEQKLGREMPNERAYKDHFMQCRFDPFNRTPTAVKIPDGRGKSVITRDYKTAYAISLTDADTLDFRISPTFPFPVRFNPDNAAGVLINGLSLGIPNTTTPPPAGTPAILGSPVATAMSTLYLSTGSNTAESTNTIGARYVTLGYRLYYTGAAALCSGIVLADNLNARITGNAGSNGTNTQYSYSVTGTLANVAIPSGSAPQISVDTTPFGYATFTSDQVVLRPENGLHGVLKMTKLASDHPFVPWYDTGAYVLQSTSAANNSQYSIYSNSDSFNVNTTRLGCFFWDDAFMETNIRLTGTGQYRLELICCMEMELAMQSNMIDLARPSPLYDMVSLNKDMYANSMVAPAPFGQPALDMRMANMNIGSRPRVRRSNGTNGKKKCPDQPKNTGKAARRRRYRQRRKSRRSKK